MANNAGISGLAVAAAGIGGYLVYAGIRDVPLVQGLREILGGATPTGRTPNPTVQFGQTLGNAAATQGAGAGVAGAARGIALVNEAQKHLGKRYVFGAVGPNTFDCSGLVVYCLRNTGMPKTPRFTTHTFAFWARKNGFQKVSETDIKAGDIVLKSGHMGIAISNTQMIHAPNATTVVKIGKIYAPRYMWSGWRRTT